MSREKDKTEEMIPYARQCIDESDIESVREVLHSEFVTQGPRQEWFESALREVTGARYAIAVSSGTAALSLVVKGLSIGEKDLGFTSAITFVASANCLRMAGAEVAFADVNPETGLSEAEHFSAAVEAAGSDPSILIPVSYAGACPDMARISEYGQLRGAWVVEDASHSIGAEYGIGSDVFKSGSCEHTDAATLSFHPVKHVCCGEGGAVLTNDETLARRIRRLRSHGIERPESLIREEGPWAYDQLELSGNYRLTDIQAALGVSQLNKLPEFLAARRDIAKKYDSAFSEEVFKKAFARPILDLRSAWHLYVIRFRDSDMRKKAYLYLEEKGIKTQVHYRPVYRNSYYEGCVDGELVGAEAFYGSCLSIPLFPSLNEGEQNRVIDALRSFCEQN